MTTVLREKAWGVRSRDLAFPDGNRGFYDGFDLTDDFDFIISNPVCLNLYQFLSCSGSFEKKN